MRIKLAIGCHNYLLGEALGKLFEDEMEIDVIAIFTEAVEFKEIKKLHPDVVFLDSIIFPNFQEYFANNGHTKIILLGDMTLYPVSDRRLAGLISRGLAGIIPPGADSSVLRKAIKAVSSGELWLDHKTIRHIIINNNHSKKEQAKYTRAEKEIASLICQGYRNKEIARKRHISEQTVKTHCNRIYKKAGVSGRLQLAIYVYELWPDWFRPGG